MQTINGYKDLEQIANEWNGEVCVFGAGNFGKGFGLDLISCAGITVDFYLDNRIKEGESVIYEKKTKSINYLYSNLDKIYVFICTLPDSCYEIEDQLIGHGVTNYSVINWYTFGKVMESVDKASDEVKKRYHIVYDNKEYITRRYEAGTGMNLNLDNPSLFNEKLQWIKLYLEDDSYTKYVDKIAFKNFIQNKYGEEYIIPIIGAWDNYADIDFDILPEKFVLKCTHDSGSTAIIKDKSHTDHRKNGRKFNDALSSNYYWQGREWPYKRAQRKIIAEKYAEDDFGELRDYKFFCFNGQVKLVQVDFDRFNSHRRNVYDIDWNYIPLTIQYPNDSNVIIPKPKCFNRMIEIAEELSQKIIHVRIDFYVIDNKPIIGEMTFFHGGGRERFDPISWNYILGEYMILPEVKER